MSSEDADSAQAGADISAKQTVVQSRDGRSEPRLVAYELPMVRVVSS
jgi:hypothetical protein